MTFRRFKQRMRHAANLSDSLERTDDAVYDALVLQFSGLEASLRSLSAQLNVQATKQESAKQARARSADLFVAAFRHSDHQYGVLAGRLECEEGVCGSVTSLDGALSRRFRVVLSKDFVAMRARIAEDQSAELDVAHFRRKMTHHMSKQRPGNHPKVIETTQALLGAQGVFDALRPVVKTELTAHIAHVNRLLRYSFVSWCVLRASNRKALLEEVEMVLRVLNPADVEHVADDLEKDAVGGAVWCDGVSPSSGLGSVRGRTASDVEVDAEVAA